MTKRVSKQTSSQKDKPFHIEFKNPPQKLAWMTFQQSEVLFLTGPAGCGKSYLAVAFAINEILAKRKSKIILTRPVVEAGENLGFLPGSASEKVEPYNLPMFDCMSKLVGNHGAQRDFVTKSLEIAPLAYMRGRTFSDAICIFDEAQNATYSQIKLFLTRIGENSKIIVTGDLQQSDLPGPVALAEVVKRLGREEGFGTVEFDNSCIVRNPIIAKILEKL